MLLHLVDSAILQLAGDMHARTLTGGYDACRIASRGNLASKASDYGGLEVFGGASIGHTDPFDVIAAVDQQLAAFTPNP